MGKLMPFSFYVYECPVCSSQFHTVGAALECCVKVREGYSCPQCGILYNTSKNADKCCSDIEVIRPINYVHKKYPALAVRWKGNAKELNYILGQGAAQFMPGADGLILCDGNVVSKGDWVIRKGNGTIEMLTDEQFHNEYETEE
jgi:hypothetical protein